MRKFAICCALILAWLALGSAPAVAESRLPPPRNLAEDAASNALEGRVLLVLFSQHGCPWCERVRREFLIPIQRNETYRSRLAFRQIDVDRTTGLIDFGGGVTTHAAFARTIGVRLYPTVMFFGPGGERLAEPLLGFNGSDFYGAFLDERIDQAAGKLRRE